MLVPNTAEVKIAKSQMQEWVEHTNEGCEIGNAAHDALDELPGQLTAADGRGLADNGTNTTRTGNGPDEEGQAAARDDIGLDGEEMADLVHREPDGRQRQQPEDEKRCVVSSYCPRVGSK